MSDNASGKNIIIILIIFYRCNTHYFHNLFYSTNYEIVFRVSIKISLVKKGENSITINTKTGRIW